jgi:ankyrin repeat protein
MMKLHGNDQYIREGFFEERQGGYSPLLFAARVGDLASARLLLAAGVDVNDTAPSGTSAVVVATHSGHPDLLALLLDNGADVNASAAGYTALHAAVLRGDEESVKVLLAHKADLNARLLKPTPVRRRSIDFAMSEKWLGATPFWLAAKFSEITIMRLLVSSGADPMLTSNDGSTPLMAAAIGADDRLGDAPPNGQHRPRADPAKEDRDTSAAVALALKFGNDINAANQAGSTALHLAARRRLVAVVQQMAEAGANVNAKTKRGETPLAVLAKPLASEDGEALESPSTERRSTQKAVSILQQFGAK